MIRVTLLLLFCLFLVVYAWKDWYKSLCGLILLVAVIQHPDMPKTLLGIQGINPWNLVLLASVLAWAAAAGREHLRWDMPRIVTFFLLTYLVVIVSSFARMMLAGGAVSPKLVGETTAYATSEYLINNIKYALPGILLFHGCRTEARFRMGLWACLGIYFLLALQVIRWMPLSAAVSGEELANLSLKLLSNEVGFHRVNLSMMLAGASWAIFSTRPLASGRGRMFLITLASLIVLFGQALTAGRTGYVTFLAVGLILCLARWRKYLLVMPVAVIAMVVLVPGAKERLTQGFTPGTVDTNVRAEAMDETVAGGDAYTITAGRNVAWPFVIDKIGESPVVGYGRQAMLKTGLGLFIWRQFGEVFPHPHNAYLELLLDNGFLGFFMVIPFYVLVLKYAFSLFRDSRDPTYVAIGGTACALVLALLFAAMGSQTFYPREGAVGMWCAIGLMLRVYVQRARRQAQPSSQESKKAEQWWPEAAPAPAPTGELWPDPAREDVAQEVAP